jgi:hypothetical protein
MQEGRFVVVNRKAGGFLKHPKDMFCLNDGIRRALEEDEGVISVLENGAGGVRDEGMDKERREGRMVKKATKNISNDDEEIGGQRVALPKPIQTIDPSSRSTIKEDNSFAGIKERPNPRTPIVRKTSVTQDTNEAFPIHTVESFMEIELKNKSRGLTAVAAMKEISSVSKTFRDAAPKHETSLISAE